MKNFLTSSLRAKTCERLRQRRASRNERSNPWIAASLAILAMTLVTPAHADDIIARRTVTVTGEAEVKKAPDKADISISIEEEDKSLEVAREETDKQLKALYRIAGETGIEKKDMQTNYSSVQPIYDYVSDNGRGNNRRVFRGYNVNHQVTLTLRDTDKLATLTEKLLAAKIDQINNVTYGLQKDDAAKDEALKAALLKAKAKAGMMASTLGESVDRVYQINESGISYQPPMPMAYARKSMAMPGAPMAMDAAAETPPSGEITVNANVTVTFMLKD